MTDPISDFIIRIKNALMANHKELLVPYSKMKKSMADILVEEGYLDSAEVIEGKPFAQIKLGLKYVGRTPAVTEVKRLSKPGRRLYASVGQIPRALGGYGITIVSTNKGLMTDKQARKANIGGELVCQIW
jgi:small subunit ribosomal protein S8